MSHRQNPLLKVLSRNPSETYSEMTRRLVHRRLNAVSRYRQARSEAQLRVLYLIVPLTL